MKLPVAVVVALAVLAGVWAYFDRGTAQLLVPLLTAGGIGGVVQSLIENRNILTLPNQVDDRRFDLGFVSDLLIGMVGAFASLIIGLAVLSERFFYDPGVAGVGGTETAGGAGVARAFAGLVISIPTWIRLASYGALTGYASRRL